MPITLLQYIVNHVLQRLLNFFCYNSKHTIDFNNREKFYGDHVFIGDPGDHLYSAIKTLQNLLFCEVHFKNITISLKMLKIIYAK